MSSSFTGCPHPHDERTPRKGTTRPAEFTRTVAERIALQPHVLARRQSHTGSGPVSSRAARGFGGRAVARTYRASSSSRAAAETAIARLSAAGTPDSTHPPDAELEQPLPSPPLGS